MLFTLIVNLLLEFESGLDLSGVTILGSNLAYWKHFSDASKTLALTHNLQASFVQIGNNSSGFHLPNFTTPTFIILDLTHFDDLEKRNTSLLIGIINILQEEIQQSHTNNQTTDSPPVICVVLNQRFIYLEKTEWREFRIKLSKKFQISSRLYFWVTGSDRGFVEAYFTKRSLTLRRVVTHQNGIVASTLYRRRSLGGQVITVGNEVGWSGISSSGSVTLAKFGRSSLNIIYLAYMQDYLNSTVGFIAYPDWITMLKSLRHRKVDTAGARAMMSETFTYEMRYLSTPSLQQKLVVYFSTPEGSKTVTQLFHIKPFRWTTWLATFVTLALLFAIHYFLPFTNGYDSFLYVLSVLTIQSINTETQNSIRIVSFAGFALFSVLNAVYSGELISSLSTRQEQKYDLQQLVDHGFSFGFENMSYLHTTMTYKDSASISRDLEAIFSHIHPTMGLTSITQGIQFLLTHQRYGFVTELNAFLIIFPEGAHMHFDNATVCNNMKYIEMSQFLIQKAPIIRPDSPFANHFNIARQRMRESGIWFRHNKEAEMTNRNSQPDCPTASSIIRRLEVSDFLLPGIFLLVGLLLCIIIFLCEFVLR